MGNAHRRRPSNSRTGAAKAGLLRRGLIRGAIPLVVFSVMALAQQLTDQPVGARGTFFAGLIFTAVAGFTVLYDIEPWSLPKQSAVHLGAMAVTVLPCLILSGWFPIDGPIDLLTIVGYFFVIGAVVWCVMYVIFAKILNRPSQEPRKNAS